MVTPTTATYAFAYPIGLTDPDGLNYPLAQNGPTTLTDDLDGDENGIVAVGADLTWSGSGSGPVTVELVGTTANGDPIILDPSIGTGFYSILSNDGGLVGQPITVSSSSDYVMCFLEGTLIATPNGPIPVQDLKRGDLISTSDNREIPVEWVGHQRLATSVTRIGQNRLIRIGKDALGKGLPHADLTVTAEHALLIDGVLCNAGALVNECSIVPVSLQDLGGTATVFHIETAKHEIILANGMPAETLIDNASRRVFDNFEEFTAIFGDQREMEELPMPRAMSARQLPLSIRQKIGLSKVA